MSPRRRETAAGTRMHVSVRVSESTYAQLEEFARIDRRRRSDVIRLALEDYCRMRSLAQIPIPFDDDASSLSA
jgi:hypothetical protein